MGWKPRNCQLFFHSKKNRTFGEFLWSTYTSSDATKNREIYVIPGTFQSKTLTVKNKNKIFPKFLSPFLILSYKNQASKIETFFDSNLHTYLIIEGLLFSLKGVVLNFGNLDFDIVSDFDACPEQGRRIWISSLCYINSTNSYVRIYKQIMQNEAN